MILNGSFLVEKNKEKQFDENLDRIYRKYKDELTFKYFGPLPPYNFVNIKIQIK